MSTPSSPPARAGQDDKPDGGYDAGTPAAGLVAGTAAPGHDRFDVVGHDLGTWTGYAPAAGHPERVGRPAVAEAVIPGLTPSPPFFGPAELNLELWQSGFDRLTDLDEELVFFGRQFATKAATRTAIPAHAVDVHVDAITADPRTLRASSPVAHGRSGHARNPSSAVSTAPRAAVLSSSALETSERPCTR
ncbi:hypothetical protein [Streptomyces sp. NPDC093260]|uniref:alpha/beta fold hydrolase n=1 Tax=Streptomyces sp. NPDC093260 TaxID=3155073 RepID=UPI00342D3A08